MEPNEVSIYKFHLGAELPLRNNFSVHINLLKQKASKHIRLDKNGVVLANRQYLVAITDAKKIGSINESRSQKHIARNGKNHKFFTLLENLNQTNKWTKKEGFGVDNGCIYFQINSFNEIPKIVEQVVLLKQILSSLSASNIIDSLRDKSSSSTHTTSYLKPIFGFKRKKLIQNNFNILDVVEDRTEQQVKRISDNKPYYYDKHHTTDGNYKRLNKYRNKQKQVRKAHAKKHNQPKHLIIEKNGIVYDIYKKKYSRKRIYFDILTRFKLQNSVYFELPHHYFKTLKINSFKQKALVDSDVALTRWIISLGFTIFGDFFSGFLEKLSTDLGNRISMFSSIKVTIGGCSPTLVGDVLDTIDSYTNRVILEQFKVYSDDLFDINEKYEDSICVICFGKIEESNNTRMLECCGSLAHTDHLKPWLLMKNKCPYCNKRMPEVVGMPAVI